MVKHQITPVNGIKKKTNGKYAVYARRMGEGTTYLVTDGATTFEEAREARRLALGNARPSAVGISRVPLGWMVPVKWGNRTFNLGHFRTEEEAAGYRIAFDEWAGGQTWQSVREALERHHV